MEIHTYVENVHIHFAHRIVVLKPLLLDVDSCTHPVGISQIDGHDDNVLLEQIKLW